MLRLRRGSRRGRCLIYPRSYRDEERITGLTSQESLHDEYSDIPRADGN